ncbi:MAG: ISAs1 family transposase [Halobacteriovoraceae bacterium]|nr:ISAs1 family transposase [Halobacteriovoraceae bacterium]
MTKKGQMPAHIQEKQFQHPQSNLRLIQILQTIPDPRKPSCNFQYSIVTVVFIVIVTTLSGADDWVGIGELAESMKDWIGKFVDITSGIPSIHTIERVFSLISPSAMEEILIELMKLLKEKNEIVINFDGKTLRGTADKARGKKAIHLLNAWSVENGICIGQKKVGIKTNEITAIPKLMEMLDLKGTIITTDALNTQKKVTQKAIEMGADYVLPVKGNHKGLLEDIELIFQDAEKKGFRGVDADQYETVEKSHGRIEKREYFSICADELPKQGWMGVKSLGMVKRERTYEKKTAKEVVFYLSSCEIDAKLLAKCVRDHWQVENGLHWSLDIIMREDQNRYRHKVGARNLSIIRKVVLGALSKDKSRKCGRTNKRLIAACNPLFREEVLKKCF